jgi:hypothetical protein
MPAVERACTACGGNSYAHDPVIITQAIAASAGRQSSCRGNRGPLLACPIAVPAAMQGVPLPSKGAVPGMMKVQSPDLRARRPVRRKHVRAVYERVALAVGGRARYLLAMLLLIGSQVVNLAVPWLAAQAIDTVQTSGVEHIVKAGLITASIFLVYVVAWLMHGPGRILERNVGLRVRQSLADALFAKLANLPLARHEAHHSADMQQRAHQASAALSDFAQSQFLYLQNVS